MTLFLWVCAAAYGLIGLALGVRCNENEENVAVAGLFGVINALVFIAGTMILILRGAGIAP